MNEKLKAFITKNLKILDKAEKQLSNAEQKTIILDNKFFDSKFLKDEDISKYDKLLDVRYIKTPVLYWFEHSNPKNNEAIRSEFINYRDPLVKDFKNPKYRYTSGYKTAYSKESKILYVGKVEKGFWGRLVTHLGYSKFKTTAGMQLYHWYKPNLFGDVKLHYIEFDNDMKHLIIILEKQLQEELKPLIGKY
jgi:hypothetical protein